MSLSTYFKEVQAETKHISWPTRRQALVSTALVVSLSLVVSLYLGFLDVFFTKGIKELFL